MATAMDQFITIEMIGCYVL